MTTQCMNLGNNLSFLPTGMNIGSGPQKSRQQDEIKLARDLLGEEGRGGTWRKLGDIGASEGSPRRRLA